MNTNLDLISIFSSILRSFKKDAIIALSISLLALLVSLNTSDRFISKMELMSSDEGSASLEDSGLGSIFSLSGLSDSQANKTQKPLRILTSSPFLIDFINYHNLDTSILNPEYENKGLDESSDIKFLKIEENTFNDPDSVKSLAFSIASSLDTTGGSVFVSVSLESYSPFISKILLEELVIFLNKKMQERAINQSQLEIDYLTKEMTSLGKSTIKNSFSKVIEQAITSSSFANMKKDYIFEVLEPPQINMSPISPNRQLIFVIAFFFGYLVMLFFRVYIYVRDYLQK